MGKFHIVLANDDSGVGMPECVDKAQNARIPVVQTYKILYDLVSLRASLQGQNLCAVPEEFGPKCCDFCCNGIEVFDISGTYVTNDFS